MTWFISKINKAFCEVGNTTYHCAKGMTYRAKGYEETSKVEANIAIVKANIRYEKKLRQLQGKCPNMDIKSLNLIK